MRSHPLRSAGRRRNGPRLARGARPLAVANVTVTISVILSAPLLPRILGPGDRGQFAAAFSLFVILRFIAPLGMAEATTRARAWHPRARLFELGRATVPIAVFAGSVLAVAMWLSADLVFTDNDGAALATKVFAVFLPVYALGEVLRSLLLLDGRYGEAGFLVASPWVIRSFALGLILLVGVGSSAAIVWCAVASVAGFVPLVAIVGLRLVGREHRSSDRVRLAGLRARAVSFGARSVAGSAASLADRRVDQVIFLLLSTDVQLGYYAVAVAVAELPEVVTRSSQVALLTEGSRTPGSASASSGIRSTVMMVSGIAALIAVLAPALLPAVFGQEFRAAVVPALILLTASVPLSAQAMGGVKLLLLDRPGAYSCCRSVSFLANVVLLLLLAPAYGAIGAAIASLAAYSLGAVIVWVVCRRLGGGA